MTIKKKQDRTAVNTYKFKVDNLSILVEEKRIENIHISVNPPLGSIKVSAPTNVNQETLRLAIIEKSGWIKSKQKELRSQDRLSEREMVEGESHYYKGKRYRLRIIETDKRAFVEIKNKQYIDLHIKAGSSKKTKEKALEKWYRRELIKELEAITPEWERKINVKASSFNIRKMKARWGSCDPKRKRININMELIKKPIICLEYIVVHELVHLIEPYHNQHFKELMYEFMPTWRRHKNTLNREPLSHEEWKY